MLEDVFLLGLGYVVYTNIVLSALTHGGDSAMLLLPYRNRNQWIVAQGINECLQGQARLRDHRAGFEQDQVNVLRRLPGDRQRLGYVEPPTAARRLELFEIVGCKLPAAEIQNRVPRHQFCVFSTDNCLLICLMLRETG